jgi:hypothetical protein
MNEQKPWQHGYDIDYLKQLEARFAHFNSYALGPFTEMKKHVIAEALHNNVLEITDDYIIETSIAKTSVPIKAYLDVVMAFKEKGDRVVSAFASSDHEKLVERLRSYEEPTWLWIWQEDVEQVAIAIAAGFKFIGSKITSFSEIRGLYFNFKDRDLVPRAFPQLLPAEQLGLSKCARKFDIAQARAEIETIGMSFTNHYSNYNKDKSWSALSLRGYTSDPAFIIKPSEMSKKWQDENSATQFELQDTAMREKLPAIEKVHEPITRLSKPHRIRLMRLAPGGGELQRHTDQTDKDTGVEDGKLMRFHFPIITNPDVVFTSWDMFGREQTVNMKPGEAWYLDTRKPHRAVNAGDSERIHLVVDVEANTAVRLLLQ